MTANVFPKSVGKKTRATSKACGVDVEIHHKLYLVFSAVRCIFYTNDDAEK